MKKRFFIRIVMVAMLLLFTSCDGDELHYLDTTTAATAETAATAAPFPYTPSEDGVLNYGRFRLLGKTGQFQYHDGYLYFLAGGNTTGDAKLGARATHLVRMNVETGNVTEVCPDPLCAHDKNSDCAMYGIGSGGFIVGPDGKYYVMKVYPTPDGFVESFVQYDAEKDTAVELKDSFPDYLYEYYTERYRIYKDYLYDEETKTAIPRIMRTDLTTFESVQIWPKQTETAGEDEMLFIIDDRLYLTDHACLYSIDLNGEDYRVHLEGKIPIHVETDGTYVYYTDQRELCRRRLDGGAEERMGIFTSGFKLTEKYIYYRSGEETVLGKARIIGYTGDVITLYGEKLCRYPLDGEGGEEVLYTFSEEIASLRPHDWIVVGNYCYCTYTYWVDPDGDGVYRDGDMVRSTPSNENGRVLTFLRIDLTTGVADVISVDEYGTRTEGELK